MDILNAKQQRQEIYDFMKKLKFSNEKIELIGTASLRSQSYFGDYDLISQIKETNPKRAFEEFDKILKRTMEDENMYFIEMKIQRQKTKTKFYSPPSDAEFIKAYKNVKFVKLDYVVRVLNDFVELSVNYFLPSDIDVNDMVAIIKEDANELMKEKKYYKVLKRVFIICKYKKIRDLVVKLSRFFNSKYGLYYQRKSRLEALKLLIEYYNDENTINKVMISLKDLHLEPNIKLIDDEINTLTKITNRQAKKFIVKNSININEL
jgi:hypothetical protein